MAITSSNTSAYLGMLFLQNKRPNAFLKMAGHFAGDTVGEDFAYKGTTAIEFPIGAFYNLPAPSQPANLEGANAPAPTSVSLTQSTNTVQIFQETVSVTYLAQSDKTISGVVPIPMGQVQREAGVANPRSTEFQVRAKLQKIAQDANYSFLNGTYSRPTDPTASALKTRGIIPAIASNISDMSAVTGTITAQQYRGWVTALMAQMSSRNGYSVDQTLVAFAGAVEYANLVAAYSALGTVYQTAETKVGGVAVRNLLTTFGTIMVVIDPDVPAQTVLLAKMDEVGIVGLEVPDKGVLFEEPLQKVGSADSTQIYGQLGIDHGPEYMHGLLRVPANVALSL